MGDASRSVFIGTERVELPAGATVLDALRAWDADRAAEVVAGRRGVADSRGLPIALDAPAAAGTILRVTSARDRERDIDAELLQRTEPD